ncbi:hypothetical protein [Cellulosimicrobium cellulans]|uniref:hypothetical protein n=1 Tax=Cellulosimicrobium cellulans TaxID=1710 RepID=UPI00382DEAC0
MTTENAGETSVTRQKAVRVLLMRDSTSHCRRLASIGVAPDGGVFVTPADPVEVGWTYGTVERGPGNIVVPIDPVTVPQQPKIHVHRSGRTYVSLTGADLPRRSAILPALGDVDQAQILSIVATRTWELPVVTPRARDVLWIVPRWPDGVSVALTLHANRSLNPVRVINGKQRDPGGLLDGDVDRYVVDLSGHGLPGILSATFASGGLPDKPDTPGGQPIVGLEPTVSVVVTSWDDGTGAEPQMGLWSANATRPKAALMEPDDLASPAHFVGEPTVLTAEPGD